MIFYHHADIHPYSAMVEAISAGHALLTWCQYDQPQFDCVMDNCQSWMLDNGAFSAWKKGKAIVDWTEYYSQVMSFMKIPSFDFAVIPDVIDGSEEDNDALLNEWPHSEWIGAPVWHLHESLDRLDQLAHEWPRICLGSSGEYQNPGTSQWWARIHQAMSVICDNQGAPYCKLHGLRMMNPVIFTRLPFSSVDSSNIARSIKYDSQWKGAYTPNNKSSRAYVLRKRIESCQAPTCFDAALAHDSMRLFD